MKSHNSSTSTSLRRFRARTLLSLPDCETDTFPVSSPVVLVVVLMMMMMMINEILS